MSQTHEALLLIAKELKEQRALLTQIMKIVETSEGKIESNCSNITQLERKIELLKTAQAVNT